MNQLVYLKDVVTLKLDEKKCVGCGMCLLVCPHAVLSLTNGTAEIVNRDACMECGAYSRNCPAEALSVQSGVGCAAAMINVMLGRTNAPVGNGARCTWDGCVRKCASGCTSTTSSSACASAATTPCSFPA